MNNQATLHRMHELSLTGMAHAFEVFLQLPIHQHPTADLMLAELVEAELVLFLDHLLLSIPFIACALAGVK